MRITTHPILRLDKKEKVPFLFNGKEINGLEGDTVASALWANNIKALRKTENRGESRGLYCGIGNCYDCRVYQKGIGMIRTCITPISHGIELFSEDRGDVSS